MKAQPPAEVPHKPGGIWSDQALGLRQLRDGSNES